MFEAEASLIVEFFLSEVKSLRSRYLLLASLEGDLERLLLSMEPMMWLLLSSVSKYLFVFLLVSFFYLKVFSILVSA